MAIIDEQVLDELSGYKDETLRDYQEDSKQKIYSLWMENRSVLLQMPTGTGKTKLFVSIINDLTKYNKTHFLKENEYFKILILAHRAELIEQISNEIRNKYHLGCSKIDATTPIWKTWAGPICVASVQTLYNRLRRWEEHPFDLIIVDEAHHARAKSYRSILRTFNQAKVLGVTATPYRMNGEGFRQQFSELIVSPNIKDFIEAGWLSNYEYYSISNADTFYRNLNNIPLNTFGEYNEDALWNYCSPNRVQAEVVGSYLKYAKGKKGIVYTINQEHNRKLCAEFGNRGIIAKGIDSHTSTKDRVEIVKRFRSGEISVLCNVNIFTEGFDCPDVEFIQLARPTNSLGLYLQQVGRGLRISSLKEKVLILDNCGLHYKFGLPSCERDWKRHFLGELSAEDELLTAEVQIAKPFVFKERESDLSKGCEDVSLIEATGLNDIMREAERDYLSSFEAELSSIIESIFKVNAEVCNRCVKGFDKEPHIVFDAEIVEDIITPCPIINAEVNNMEAISKRIENEFKPIVVNGEIDYVQYKDWKDFESTAIQKVKKLFKKELSKAQSENFALLDKFTANQLRVFFINRYGKEHNMSEKLSRYCNEYDLNDTWEIMKKTNILKVYRKKIVTEKRIEDDILMTSTSYEYYD